MSNFIVLLFKEEPTTPFFIIHNNLMSTDIKKAKQFNTKKELEDQLDSFPNDLRAVIIITENPHEWIQNKN